MRFYRHDFGDNRTLDYVVRLAEIIKRYEFLVEEMQTVRPAYVFGGELTLAAWLERLEATVVADALVLTGGVQVEAMRVLGESHRRHFGSAGQQRIAYAQRTFAEVQGRRTSGSYRLLGER